MKRRNVLSSPRLSELKRHRKRAILNKFLFLIFGIAATFAFLAYVSRLNSLNISQVQISGNQVLDAEEIKSVVQEQLTGKYLWLFPKTNILYYSKGAIQNILQDKFKRIGSVSLSVKNNQSLQISITERVAKYIWCGSVIAEGKDSKCYFLDESGYMFDEAPYFSGNVYFKFYGLPAQAGGSDLTLGSYFFKQNFKQFISFKDTLIGFGLKPAATYLTNDGDMQIFLSGGISATSGPKIILKADADFQNVAENLQAALSTEPLKSNFKNKYSKLEYIDLRFGNKVYDKFSS
jgi:cell division septal protein FtsQ